MKKKINKTDRRENILKIVDWVLLIFLFLLTGFLVFNIVKLSNIENLIRIVSVVILILILGLLFFFRRKRALICRIIMILLCCGYSFLNYTFYKLYSSLDNITAKVDTKVICLVTSLSDVTDIEDMTTGDIAILNASMDEELNQFVMELMESKGLENELVEYDDYLQIIKDLLNQEIDYAFLPENYNDIYNASVLEEEKRDLEFNVLYKGTKVIEKDDTSDLKSIDEPFTILLMGTDDIADSYNADTLLLMTVNPKTLKVTMLSIPRDTYTVIACTGGKHKINSSGWYGDSCVVKTIEKYLDIDIDYYAKINFFGVVELVDNLGGIEVDVPYSFCEQNSQRQFVGNMIYVDEGMQTLNGEQALALSRNRHYWEGLCPSKYTTDGNRSDLTRGQNQQLVIKAILNKLMTIRDINKFYSILDIVSNNMTTNMSREKILSFYNIGKEIVKKLNYGSVDEVINIKRLEFESYSTSILISGLNLSMIVNYDESVLYVSREMKKNLELIEEDVIKEFSFDINEVYDPDDVSYDRLSTSLSLLPSFVGKSLSEAISYCNKNGLRCESNSGRNTGTIVSQSIGANTDIATIKNKTITFDVEKNVVANVIIPSGDYSNSDEVVTNESSSSSSSSSDDDFSSTNQIPSSDDEEAKEESDLDEEE